MITFAPTSEQTAWIEKATALKPIFAERARELDERGGWPEENFELLRDQGFLKLAIPREYGGLGTEASWCAFTPHAVVETIASACGSTGWALLSQYHAQGLVAGLGNESQKTRILGDVADNGVLIASVGSEVRAAQASSPSSHAGKLTFESELTPTDGGFLANGIKGFSTMGAASKYLLYWALAPGTDNPSVGVTVGVTAADDPGVTFLPGWEEAIGIRASLSGGAKFENVFIPWDNILGEPGDHTQIHPYTFELTYAVQLLGLTQGVYEVIKRTLSERPFLQDDDTTMFTVGEMASAIQAVRTSWWYAQWMWDQEAFDEAAHATLLALHQAKITALMVTQKAFDVIGVRALFKWNPIERPWRDVRTVTLHTRETQLMRLVAEAEVNGSYFAKSKYGFRLPAEERVTWADLGLAPSGIQS